MIFGGVWRLGASAHTRRQVRSALTAYGGEVSESETGPATLLLAGPGSAIGTSGKIEAVLYGWIDNIGEVAEALRVPATNPSAVYAAAVARWGVGADRHVIGSYAAIVAMPDRSLRCSRSPWDAPPLHYAHDEQKAVASPLLHCLFAAGVDRAIDRERLIDELAIDRREGDWSGWYKGTWRVPLGAVVTIAPRRHEAVQWYSPPLPAPTAPYREPEAVEEALRLLDEAGRKALAWAGKPALSLSGGLDSTLVGSALVRALPPGATLDAITWVPSKDWSGLAPPGKFGDESELARHFIAANPQVRWHQTGREVGSFDRHAREVFSTMACFAPGLANTGMHHDVFSTARSLGCDAVLTADMGNATFSEAGEAAYREYPRLGHWEQYRRLVASRPNDPRPLWRRIAALTLVPLLPSSARKAVRAAVHPARKDLAAHFSPLSKSAWREQRERAKARGSRGDWEDFIYDRDRRSAVARHWAQADGVQHDVTLAFEQIYGIRRRDVTAYRPLIEFCMQLPTRAFAWDGRERRLARLMGERRLPEAIHANLLHGQHNVDWHERLGRDLASLDSLFRSAAMHPLLGEVLDIDRILGMLRDWPAEPGWDWDRDMPRFMVITRALMAVRFVGAMEGSNEL